MIYSLTWLPEVLLDAGLKVAQTTDWQSRGRGPMGVVRGVICHHTASSASENMPSLQTLIAGRSDLAGPLAQLGLGRDGTFYVIAAGRANHAGRGTWENYSTGNSSFIGIEAENDGKGEPWPQVQMEAYQRGVAAILGRLGAGANMCCGHKEYALPHGRKIDPTFDMAEFRRGVDAFLTGKTPSPLIPTHDEQQRPTLRRGSKGATVQQAQTLLRVPSDGFFGPDTEAALRAFQRGCNLVPDGILGPKTWAALANSPIAPVSPPGLAVPRGDPLLPAKAVAVPARSDLPLADSPTQKPKVVGRKAFGPDGSQFAITQSPGFYTVGKTTLAEWILGNPRLPGALSEHAKRVVSAMSTVEGGLEAVNSYDDAHLSFGVFQWTAGTASADGELAVLLTHFKAIDPDGFDLCFGCYGLDAEVRTSAATTGILSLGGTPLITSDQKDALRSLEWAYRFWRAGHHEMLRACELMFAASRINRFAMLDVFGKPLLNWMNSELAVALVLDEHVNRPSHVPGTLKTAIASLNAQGSDPSHWSDAEEHHLINAYLTQRETSGMTSSDDRARKIESSGLVSEVRGSFSTPF